MKLVEEYNVDLTDVKLELDVYGDYMKVAGEKFVKRQKELTDEIMSKAEVKELTPEMYVHYFSPDRLVLLANICTIEAKLEELKKHPTGIETIISTFEKEYNQMAWRFDNPDAFETYLFLYNGAKAVNENQIKVN